jgi:tetratricopeptide (TPR) repeat protein
MIWGLAWEGFKERPIVGWGQEGFNYVFNKYYNPGMYAQEPWFDRAHNAFIDWLMAGGLPAFLLYISLFIVGIWMLWRSALPRAERIALTCIIAGYAFHNLFVFDNLYSYVYFFAVLAVIDSQIGKSLSTPKKEIVRAQTSVVLPIASAAVLVLVYVINVPGIWTASTLISALTPQSGGISANLQIFTDLAHNPSFAAQEVREQIVSFATNVVQSKDIPDQIKIQAVTLAITEMQKQLAAYPDDAREHLQLALAYRTANNPDKVEEIDAAIKLSPAKQQMWLQKGITFFELNRLVEAQQSFDKAYELGPQFSELAKYAALGRIAVQDLSGADEIFKIHPEVVAEVEAIVKQPTQAKK